MLLYCRSLENMAFKHLTLVLVVILCHQPNVSGAETNMSVQYLNDWCNHHTKVNSDGSCIETGTFTIPGNCTSFYECTENENATAIVAHIKSCEPGFIFDILGCAEHTNTSQCPQMSCATHGSVKLSNNNTTPVNQTQEIQMDDTRTPMSTTTENDDIILLPVSNETLVVLTEKFISNLQQKNVMNESVEARQQMLNYSLQENVNETLVDSPLVEAQLPEENITVSSNIESQGNKILNMSLPIVTNGKLDSILIHATTPNEFEKEENHTQNPQDSEVLNSQEKLIGSKEVHLSNLSSIPSVISKTLDNTTELNVTSSESSDELDTQSEKLPMKPTNQNGSIEVDDDPTPRPQEPQNDDAENEIGHLAKSQPFSHASSSSSSSSYSGSSYLKVDFGIITCLSLFNFGLLYLGLFTIQK